MAAESELQDQVPPHPRLLPELFGHADAQAHLALSIAQNHLHSAQLISGPAGIGKATLAYRLATHLLGGGKGEHNRLDVDEEGQAKRWVAAQSHPDLFVLEREYDPKAKRLKTEISVEGARRLSEFFTRTAGGTGWRIAIIDTVDDLNNASANALLKLVEEPPPRSLLLLLANNPGRVLRTIRSRCVKLHLHPLNEVDLARAVAPLEAHVEQSVIDHAITLSHTLGGLSPGLIWNLSRSEALKAYTALDHAPALNAQTMIEIGNRFTGRGSGSAENFELFSQLLLSWLARKARGFSDPHKRKQMAEAYAGIEHSLHQTNALNLDRRQTVIAALSRIEAALT